MTSPRGFTLIEAVVVVSITALMMLVVTNLILMFYRTSEYTLENAKAINNARAGIETATRDIREATYANDGSYPLLSIATSSITVYANVDNDTQVERIRYQLSNGTLYRIVANPTGNPPTYTNPTYATTTVAESVANTSATPLFRYYDTTSTEIVPPGGNFAPFLLDVASVQMTLIIDINTKTTPLPFTLSNWARLRNI